ncbi:galactarate dehydratase [Rhodoferax sp. U11-2br]|uniref:galactarate dehydratase n=1 Tax=Rhodoferax sp. U11-2br TaxID=2838878 RepID=UPI001BEC249C|nr:galactarate dehydratase [Rhodoferax sp. U11-2br]MBT3068181.1 galactarate dehydratase [Rhodoferax sp. U11-2br]
MNSTPLFITMHPADNVAIVVNDGGLPAGAVFGNGLRLVQAVPQGHKVALVDLPQGSTVRRYNVSIGETVRDLPAGSWVNESVLLMPDARALDNLPLATQAAPDLPPLEGYTFEGYRNADGSVGTRNILAITTTVQCVSGVVAMAVKRIKAELLPKYPNVDDVVGLEHAYGCGVAIDAPDAIIPIRTLRHISQNPNFGGELMVVSLGCEKLQPERLLPANAIAINSVSTSPLDTRATSSFGANSCEPEPLDVVCLQSEQHVGLMSMIDAILQSADKHLARLNARQRETVPASELVVGVQCGGSDAFSGVTANPAVGFCADLLVRAGATVMFSEVTEVRDGIDQLTARASSPEVAQAMVREMAWYDAYLAQGSADRSANTTPGNKKGGLSNIVEKAMGSIIKSGSAAISGVLSPGESLRGKGITSGLVYAATPASDFVCGTLQLAAGMNMHVFTTGRGTPYGLAECPVIKVATRSDLARRWHDLMDVNAGRIAEGSASIEDVGWELFHLMLDVASGRKQTWAEQWQLHNALTLFNPAPIT